MTYEFGVVNWTNGPNTVSERDQPSFRTLNGVTEFGPMKTLATALGALTAVVLLSGCAYHSYDRYAYGYGRGYYGNPNYYGNCWVDRYAVRHCVR